MSKQTIRIVFADFLVSELLKLPPGEIVEAHIDRNSRVLHITMQSPVIAPGYNGEVIGVMRTDDTGERLITWKAAPAPSSGPTTFLATVGKSKCFHCGQAKESHEGKRLTCPKR